jgi:hypothetical protein
MRNLSRSAVLETVTHPYSVIGGKYGRRIAQKVQGDHLVRVVFKDTKTICSMVTAYPSKPARYLGAYK